MHSEPKPLFYRLVDPETGVFQAIFRKKDRGKRGSYRKAKAARRKARKDAKQQKHHMGKLKKGK